MIKLRKKILNNTIYTVNRTMECSTQQGVSQRGIKPQCDTPFLMPQIIECSGFG